MSIQVNQFIDDRTLPPGPSAQAKSMKATRTRDEAAATWHQDGLEMTVYASRDAFSALCTACVHTFHRRPTSSDKNSLVYIRRPEPAVDSRPTSLQPKTVKFEKKKLK